jgi:hypothetical protein
MTGEKGLSFDSLDRLAEALGLEIIIRPKITQKKLKQRTVKHGKRDKRQKRAKADSVCCGRRQQEDSAAWQGHDKTG